MIKITILTKAATIAVGSRQEMSPLSLTLFKLCHQVRLLIIIPVHFISRRLPKHLNK